MSTVYVDGVVEVKSRRSGYSLKVNEKIDPGVIGDSLHRAMKAIAMRYPARDPVVKQFVGTSGETVDARTIPPIYHQTEHGRPATFGPNGEKLV